MFYVTLSFKDYPSFQVHDRCQFHQPRLFFFSFPLFCYRAWRSNEFWVLLFSVYPEYFGDHLSEWLFVIEKRVSCTSSILRDPSQLGLLLLNCAQDHNRPWDWTASFDFPERIAIRNNYLLMKVMKGGMENPAFPLMLGKIAAIQLKQFYPEISLGPWNWPEPPLYKYA